MRLPDTKIVRDGKYITIRIPVIVMAGMTQEYWDMLAKHARLLVPDDTLRVSDLKGRTQG